MCWVASLGSASRRILFSCSCKKLDRILPYAILCFRCTPSDSSLVKRLAGRFLWTKAQERKIKTSLRAKRKRGFFAVFSDTNRIKKKTIRRGVIRGLYNFLHGLELFFATNFHELLPDLKQKSTAIAPPKRALFNTSSILVCKLCPPVRVSILASKNGVRALPRIP